MNGGRARASARGGGATRKGRDQNGPSVNQKTQLSFSISSGNAQRAALLRGIAGLDENNYGIISSSDNPRLIQRGFASQNQVKGEEASERRRSHARAFSFSINDFYVHSRVMKLCLTQMAPTGKWDV